jgi:hypothetical protein
MLLVMVMPPACSQDGGDGGNDNVNGNNDNGDFIPDDGSVTTKVPAGFPPAARVDFDPANRLAVDGEIVDPQDVVVYDLGALQLGDWIDVLCLASSGSSLDPMVALFDADGYRVFWNDDINPATRNYDAAFAGYIRHDSANYFLAVTSTDFFGTTGAFRCSVALDPQVGVATIVGQTVVLHWAAADDVVVANVPRGDLPPFDAANLSSTFAGQTGTFQQRIVEIVGDDFAPFDVTIVTTDDDLPAANVSRVYFGLNTTESIFGIADQVDFYNGSDMDNAIVFLGALGSITKNAEASAQATANVVSHEIGHLLGLMHTTDVTTLMDTTGAGSTLLDDQSFGVAELNDFPIGLQNAPLLLEETVGRAAAGGVDGVQYRCGTCGATLNLLQGE